MSEETATLSIEQMRLDYSTDQRVWDLLDEVEALRERAKFWDSYEIRGYGSHGDQRYFTAYEKPKNGSLEQQQ